MVNKEIFRNGLKQLIDLRHPVAVLARRMPWEQIETALAPVFSRQDRWDKSSRERTSSVP